MAINSYKIIMITVQIKSQLVFTFIEYASSSIIILWIESLNAELIRICNVNNNNTAAPMKTKRNEDKTKRVLDDGNRQIHMGNVNTKHNQFICRHTRALIQSIK